MGKAKKDYSKRVHFMDTARGIIIIGVVVYHTLFDLYAMYGIGVDSFLFHPIVNYVRDFGAGLLIFISGISCNLSRSNLKRGIMCLGIALGFSFFTYFVLGKENFIFIGVLHLLSFCMLSYTLLRKLIDKIPGYVAPVIFVVFLFVFNCMNGYLGFFEWELIQIPKIEGNIVTYCLGWPWYKGISSADYFPIFPWFLLFLTGTIVGRYVKEGKIPKFLYADICPPITYIGTKTIYIYVLHQPIVYGALFLIFNYIIK